MFSLKIEADFLAENKKNRTIHSKNKDFFYSKLDHLPEAAFNLCGTIDEAITKGEKMLKEV